ncbi:hypothetical protein SPRG_14754 [Saprolegnia parasitica CBS 223.65]|uniref:Tubulin-tyrosine ligase n=1 Tax=Saprolegnia parasitica (strain CBS 223.65) TaxID=695850 RepID=A0A067BMK5_SAPPC|nr:hypothetical protein SPRG_14754 [Saprolegnia parasitica CBS 223.65]KDO19674.1 hypothetical protein SPRG_14754 [Saprolegnia parasitica CBS 223.65]|eukprot:XP_012209592.1 hypothetical protein SPRG_14754 [Saprolegnia parasitica CBS 223.65]
MLRKKASSEPSGPVKSRRKVVVDVSLCRYAIIKRCLKARDFRLVREKNANAAWDIWWSDRGELLKDARRLHAFQKVNHFPSMEDICRKDFLATHLNAMRKALPDAYDYYPRSFLLPADRIELQQAMEHDARGATYIIKPRTLCQGKGIKLVQSFGKIPATEPCVAQRYVANPLLIDGFKFDLRIYVLVTSVDPLRVHIFRNGLARFCTTPFERPTKANLNAARMHLTNYAINKKAKEFVKSTDDTKGSKRSLAFVMAYIARHGLDPSAVWAEMCDIILKTLLAIQPRLQASYRNFFGADAAKGRTEWGPAAFEILGFDIMLDDKGKSWLFEVNHAPSFAGEAKLDREIKTPLIEQALDLINVTNKRKRIFLARNRRAWKERLWNAALPTKAATETKPEATPETSAAQESVPEVDDATPREDVENNDEPDDADEAEDDDEVERDETPSSAKRPWKSSNRVHPSNGNNQDDADASQVESIEFTNVYELIYPPKDAVLQATYDKILTAAETNRSKLWG